VRSYKAQALLIAILSYITILVAIFISVVYEPKLPKAKNYTANKSEVIEVSLGSPMHQHSRSKSKSKTKKTKKPHKKPKKIRNVKPKESKPKKVVKKTKNSKKAVKKVVKKVPKKSQTKPNIDKLFGSVDNIKPKIKSNKPQGNSGKSLLKKNKSSGIKNEYFAKVQQTLMGWPAQSNFAGEMVVVELIIYPTGLFDYKILRQSLNPEFNSALKSYLEQLKRVGFGPHSNPKPYDIVVKFKAKN